ncbi:hypothetical protein FPOA_07029 [Fusarium poae]|uniref:Uncharacterized protein n=1 Tax=Fusarium poae TaxID=36050 RepID=A0A1B8AJN7_FUSPO|nr:hypothetical protein FPOA_07029 [Fusarium poae]
MSMTENPIARKAARAWVSQSSDANIDELVGYLHKPPSNDWSAKDEADVEQIWWNSDAKDAKEMIGPNTHSELLTLFKICLRVRGCTPTQLISPLTNLRYLPTVGATGPFCHLYSNAFCKALSTILVHPCMRKGKTSVILTLQYAIMTRIDDCTVWAQLRSRIQTMRCPAITQTVNRVINEIESGLMPRLHAVHRDVRSQVLSRGETPSQLSVLLCQIGEIVLRNAATAVPSEQGISVQFGREVLPLTLEDLTVVQTAIDSMEWPEGYGSFACTTAEALFSYNLTDTRRDIPGRDTLADFFERGHKQLLRDCLPEYRQWREKRSRQDKEDSQNQSFSDVENSEISSISDVEMDSDCDYWQGRLPPDPQPSTEVIIESDPQSPELASAMDTTQSPWHPLGTLEQIPGQTTALSILQEVPLLRNEIRELKQKVQDQSEKMQELVQSNKMLVKRIDDLLARVRIPDTSQRRVIYR